MSNLLRNAAVQWMLTAAFLCTAAAVGGVDDAAGSNAGDVAAQPGSPTPATTLAHLKWLSGCWMSDTGQRQQREQWMAPSGGMMLGISHTVVDGKTREYEFMRIVQEENGDIYFVANPSGQKEARFKMVRSDERSVMFENPEHDFPHRVIYRLEHDGSLVGRIEGISKGRAKAVDFPLKRVVCDG